MQRSRSRQDRYALRFDAPFSPTRLSLSPFSRFFHSLINAKILHPFLEYDPGKILHHSSFRSFHLEFSINRRNIPYPSLKYNPESVVASPRERIASKPTSSIRWFRFGIQTWLVTVAPVVNRSSVSRGETRRQ